MGTPGPFVVMLRLLERTDGCARAAAGSSWRGAPNAARSFVQETAARLLSKLLSSRPDRGKGLGLGKAGEAAPPPPAPGSAAATCLSFLDWAVRTLRSPSHDRATAAAVGALAGLMAERELRAPAYRAGALALLAPAMRAAAAPPQAVQLLYEASLCVWLLTFLPAAAEATLSTGALAGLIETARAATKEKVVRVALAALRNLLESDGSAPGARAAAVAASGRLAATLRLKAFHDEEVLASIAALEAAAAAGAKAAGGFERYRQEVLSGALDWGGGRSSDSFWREHALGLEEHGFAVVKALCAILSSPSAPPRALAVACFDVGCIAAALPHGRVVISEAGGKAACMRLMAHEDEEVRKQALIATQKLLVVGWAFLEK